MKKKSVIKLPSPELLYPYSPVAKPMPPPPIDSVCDAPRVQVEFSCSLIPYLLGLLEVYRYKDSFTGTDEEKTKAVGIMRQLMEELAMAGCGCDDDKVIIHRINPETGEVEISEDNGETWTTDPQSPYVQATIYKPLMGEDGEVKRCEAANNVVEHLKDVQAGFSGKIGEINNITDMLASIIVVAVGMLFLPVAGAALVALLSPLLTKLFEVARLLTNTTQGAYDALFTEENWTLTRCILYCNVSDDGSFTQAAWSKIQSDMKDQMGAGAQQAGANLAAMVDVWGLPGLNNAARIGSGAEGNCDDCDCPDAWCYLFDFEATMAQQGWVQWVRSTGGGGISSATWTGQGWQSNPTGGAFPFNDDIQSSIRRSFTDEYVTAVTINWHGGNSALNYGCRVQVVKSDDTTQEFNSNGVGMFTKIQLINLTVKEIKVSIEQSGTQSGFPPEIIIDDVTFEGEGTNPIGEDNCP